MITLYYCKKKALNKIENCFNCYNKMLNYLSGDIILRVSDESAIVWCWIYFRFPPILIFHFLVFTFYFPLLDLWTETAVTTISTWVRGSSPRKVIEIHLICCKKSLSFLLLILPQKIDCYSLCFFIHFYRNTSFTQVSTLIKSITG